MNYTKYAVLIILIFLTFTFSQKLRDIKSPSDSLKLLHVLKDSTLTELSGNIYKDINKLKVNRNFMGNLAVDIFYKTIDYNTLKYDLFDQLDTLKFIRYMTNELASSNHFNKHYKDWNGEELKQYITFRVEWEILKYFKAEFDIVEFKNSDIYSRLKTKLLEDGISEEQITDVLSKVDELNVYPIHFYYRTKSIEQQMKADKFDIKKFNFFDIIEFYKDNLETLEKAEKKYNVNKEIIVGILRKETNFGRYKLTNKPYEVLLSQAIYAITNHSILQKDNPNSPKRIKRLKKSAENSLYHITKYIIDNKLDPVEIRTNSVGAMGYPQFMPFNLHLAVDGDGDGKADLSNIDDAIMSIGSYLADRGWKKHYPLDRINKPTFRKFIGTYNKSESYTEAVFEIAYELKKRMAKPVE